MADKSIRAYSVQCAECFKILGLSIKNFQTENIFCLKCGKDRIIELSWDKDDEK